MNKLFFRSVLGLSLVAIGVAGGYQLASRNQPDAATAQRYREQILAAGNSQEPGAAYRAFRGRDAQIEPMLKGRGLIPA